MGELRYLASEGWTQLNTVRVPEDPLAWIRRLAEIQGGVVDRAQLIACGLSNTAIARLIGKGWLIRIYPGVYALGHANLTNRGRLVAPLLYASWGSALSHGTAGHLWQLLSRAPKLTHVSSPRQRRSLPDVRIHRPRALGVELHNGLPITGVAQTIMDVAPQLDDYELEKALANADFHGLLDTGTLKSVMGRGNPGSARLRWGLKEFMPELAMTLSHLEDMLLLLCRKHNVPLPEPNRRIGPHTPDGVWPEAMLIVEVDGGGNHSSPTQRRIDAERDMYFRSLGYLVLRYTYWQVKRQGAAVAAELKTTIAARRTAFAA